MRLDRIAMAACLLFAAATLRAQPAPATTQAASAVDLYVAAASLIGAESPAASNLEYPDYPPFGDEWTKFAANAWAQNVEARDLAREGNAAPANWPAGTDWKYLNPCRALANEFGDAALYRGLVGGDLSAAIGFLHDTLDLADKLRAPPLDERIFLHALVAGGIDALATNRAFLLAPELSTAKDAPVDEVRRAIARLLETPDAAAALESARANGATPAELGRGATTFARIRADRRMAAMSLACQLYRRDKGAWPARAGDLVPAYLPALPLDPAGDGTMPLGYALIDKALPDGGGRPMVYSRLESPDGLAYRTDAPQYGFYAGDGSSRPARDQRHAGQFRDVARWAPAAPPTRTATPALAPLDAHAP